MKRGNTKLNPSRKQNNFKVEIMRIEMRGHSDILYIIRLSV